MAHAARESLGLTEYQANRMFSPANSRGDLVEYVERLHENNSA